MVGARPEGWLAVVQAEKAWEGFEWLTDAGEERGLIRGVGLDPEAEGPSGTREGKGIVWGERFCDTDAAGDGVHVERTVRRCCRSRLGDCRGGGEDEKKGGDQGFARRSRGFQLHRASWHEKFAAAAGDKRTTWRPGCSACVIEAPGVPSFVGRKKFSV